MEQVGGGSVMAFKAEYSLVTLLLRT